MIILVNLLNFLLSLSPAFQELFAFRSNKYAGRDEDEAADVIEGEGFRHENLLKRMPVDDKHLSDDRSSHRDEESLVGK